MEIALNKSMENNIQNNIEMKQNNFLQSILGKAINNGINIGLRYLLPNWVEDKVIELKDNIFNYGLKDGIDKTIKTAIETGKSAVGIVTGNFENVNQINEAVKNGGIIDSVSEILDMALNKMLDNNKINNTTFSLIKNGKDSILSNVEKNIQTTLSNQMNSYKNMDKFINNWKTYYNKKDFDGMEKEYINIENNLRKLIPIENTINEARKVENLHNLIKNNGHNFNLSEKEIELANNLKIPLAK